jgi:hypothetical protein
MKQFIPANLDIDKLITDQPPMNIANFKKDHLIYILDLITSIPATNKAMELIDGFVPIHAAILQSRIKNYRQYFDYLLQAGVLLTDNRFIKGVKSIGYKFTPAYSGIVRPVDLRDRRFISSLRRDDRLTSSDARNYRHLTKWYTEHLGIRYDLALDFMTQDLLRKLANPALRDRDKRTSEYVDPWRQYNSALLCVEKIAAGAFRISIDHKGFRLHSELSSIRSSVRNCLVYNDLELVCIDICNSQPYLISLLLNSSFWREDGITDAILHITNLYTSTNRVLSSTSRSSIIMIAEKGEKQADSGFQAYKELVRSGQFYDHMALTIQNKCGAGFTDRKAVKAMLFQVLFTDNRFIGQEEAGPKRLFKNKFPGVYQLLSEIKKAGKATLPILLQQIESHLVLQVITKRISRERPSLPIFTIHDSIVTTAGNEDYVQEIVKEELGKAVGFSPLLRVEHWSPEHLRFGDGTPFVHNRKAVA